MEEFISKKAAEEEVNAWLDGLDIDQERRDDPFISRVIKDIVKAVMKGLWIINADGTITQKLIVPLGEKGVTSEITYNNRYKIGSWHDKLKKVPPTDNLGMVMAKLSLLSELPEKVFANMDKSDYDVASNVAVFF